MAPPAGTHESLRHQWAETPPDVSYRFVVSFGTLQAADAVALSAFRKKANWWRRGLAYFLRDILRFSAGALIMALFAWLALQPALVVDRALDATQRFGSGALLPI